MGLAGAVWLGDRDPRVPEKNIDARAANAASTIPINEYSVGQPIRAKYKGHGAFNGTVQVINTDGTYDILFEDGDRDHSVPLKNILSSRGPPPSSPSTKSSAAAADIEKA